MKIDHRVSLQLLLLNTFAGENRRRKRKKKRRKEEEEEEKGLEREIPPSFNSFSSSSPKHIFFAFSPT